MAEKFKKQFICLGENTQNYMTFTVQIEKDVKRVDKNAEEITKHISYILQFIDSTRFMASFLPNLVNNLSGRILRIKCELEHDDKKWQICGIKYTYWDCFLE